jgi:hypothetical protein
MASFIIDNGGRYSDHAVYFVEAPLSFEKWFNGTLLTWLEAHDMHGEKLLNDIYGYANDSHITTALKKICSPFMI